MFFKQVRRNAAKNRKGNGLLYGLLVVAIVAFYTLLSMGEQDIVRFLQTLESDAVNKLLALIPAVYVISLFFVFFLVFFAYKYMMESRRREFGMYLMLGMRRVRLFAMLLCETLWNSLVSLLIGLPTALLLTEGVSLITAKLVGLGIMGHTVSFSLTAILWTVCGFVCVQFVSMLLLCAAYSRVEPAMLLRSDAAKKQKPYSTAVSIVFSVLGVLLLGAAYVLGLFRMSVNNPGQLLPTFAALIVCGITGTFFLYRGMGGILGILAARRHDKALGLATFTRRQVQQSVLSQHRSLAVASLLMLLALAGISFGIATGASRASDERTADFSLFCTQQELDALLADEQVSAQIAASYPVYLSRANTEFDIHDIINALSEIDGTEDYTSGLYIERVLSVSSYNHMMQALGKPEITLGANEAALYSNIESEEVYANYRKMLESGVCVGIGGAQYTLQKELHTEAMIADRGITLMGALIVTDADYERLALDQEPSCYNLHLTKALTDRLGLMQAIEQVGSRLDAAGLDYNSYLAGIGRNLLYTVAASYMTIYPGVLFLLIANTVIGVKYLIQQRENKHRYITLRMLGADTKVLCGSARKQIQMFFNLVLGVALVSGGVAVTVLFTNFVRLPTGTPLVRTILIAAVALALLVAGELFYIAVVKRTACREIRAQEITDRG